MRALFAAFALFAVSVLVHAQGQRSDAADDEAKLIALENAWNLAQLHHDGKALDGLVGDKFVYTDYDGKVMNKAESLAETRPIVRP